MIAYARKICQQQPSIAFEIPSIEFSKTGIAPEETNMAIVAADVECMSLLELPVLDIADHTRFYIPTSEKLTV